MNKQANKQTSPTRLTFIWNILGQNLIIDFQCEMKLTNFSCPIYTALLVI